MNRGKWVLETILGAPPIRPPAGLLQALAKSSNNLGSGGVRELVEIHRANPSCAQCHWKMDAIGIALENFDGRGKWRTEWNTGPIDASAVFPDGEKVNGVGELKGYLLKNRDSFVRALSEALLRDALGRKLNDSDRLALQSIPQKVADHEHRFSQVILEVVLSAPFRDFEPHP